MGAYEPKFLYGDQITGTAATAITGGQVLAVAGNGTVGPAGAASAAVVGVAAFDAASGARVSYFPRGKVHVSTASGAITAAARVDSGAAGTVASGTAAVTNVGIALTTAADGAAVEWMEI
ncbi:capsid cement protein [Micromonospora carbonacea]|uniref:capsid cement protein n=1 Tax=Micromonospora carbonacea TaxID=47853 RepID=UPI003719B006